MWSVLSLRPPVFVSTPCIVVSLSEVYNSRTHARICVYAVRVCFRYYYYDFLFARIGIEWIASSDNAINSIRWTTNCFHFFVVILFGSRCRDVCRLLKISSKTATKLVSFSNQSVSIYEAVADVTLVIPLLTYNGEVD